MHRTLARVAAAAVLAAAAYAGLPAAPAAAAGCPTDHGVTVVVDFHQLGGGVQTACVADGGGQTAAQLFPAAGFPLTYVQSQRGFVCRVSGEPADDPCANTPPADAYWALYWSDGETGRWSYATSGAGGQHVPDGGYVAFSWQGSHDSTPPGASPAPHPGASPSPTHAPTHATPHPSSSAPPSAHATEQGGSPSATPSQAPSATESSSGDASPAPGAKHRSKPKPRASESPTPTTGASPTASASPSLAPASADPADPGAGGLPGWVAPVVILLLFGAAGAVAVVRRRQGAG
ncbi:hypothetical protein [Nocardioides aquiterrae]|uniref:Uncharacterized protein n=1 Tax=Nocardioides aquiterrae TaxID=203799 RepID=A0ABP4FCP5_9ACTN